MMLTIADIRTKIDSLRDLMTNAQIQDGIQNIFYDLIYADQPLYVKMSNKTPAILQSTLYIYSHQGMGGEEYTYTDVLQMSVYALKNGADKIVLNEGDKWVTIGIPDFLRIFYERICNNSDLFDYEFARLTTIGNGYKLENNQILPCENSHVSKNDVANLSVERIYVTMLNDDSGFYVSKNKLLSAMKWRCPIFDWHFEQIDDFNLFYKEQPIHQETPPATNPSPKSVKRRFHKSSKDVSDKPEQELACRPKKKVSLKIIASLCAAALLLCIGSVFVYCHLNQTKRFNQFCLYVDRMDYSNAHMSYLENSFGSKADKYLIEHLDKLVDDYADNNLGAGELEGALMGLSNFESVDKELEMAKITASKLEASKNAFVEGQEEEDAFRKLLAWQNVIELDRVNYAAVQEAVKDNQGNLVMNLDKSLSYYDTRAWDFAKQRYDVMQYWFPQNTTTLSWGKKYDNEKDVNAKFSPINISKLQIAQDADGYWNLYINWKNASVKPIQYICFSVTAINSDGEYVVNTDAHGSWSIFDAVDINLYEAASGPEAGKYGWEDVFYGSEVADVKLTGVNITYSDNSTDTFTNPIDLQKMQHFFN